MPICIVVQNARRKNYDVEKNPPFQENIGQFRLVLGNRQLGNMPIEIINRMEAYKLVWKQNKFI